MPLLRRLSARFLSLFPGESIVPSMSHVTLPESNAMPGSRPPLDHSSDQFSTNNGTPPLRSMTASIVSAGSEVFAVIKVAMSRALRAFRRFRVVGHDVLAWAKANEFRASGADQKQWGHRVLSTNSWTASSVEGSAQWRSRLRSPTVEFVRSRSPNSRLSPAIACAVVLVAFAAGCMSMEPQCS